MTSAKPHRGVPSPFGRMASIIRLGVCAALVLLPRSLPAQLGQRSIPSIGYHAGIGLLAEGEYKDALDHLQDAWKGAIKTTQSRWIDSICYHAMLGECYYQVGELETALEHYTAAVRLYLAFPDWMRRVEFPATVPVGQAPSARGTPWGVSTRPAKLGRYPEMNIAQGRLDNNSVIKQGGVIQMPQLVPIQVHEIVRSTVLAIRRRGELLGPIAKYDPLNNELIAVLSQRPGVANHWSQVWIDAPLGVALLYGGKGTEAVAMLNRSLVAAGEFDHPLTATSLLELGKIALASGNHAEAARLFLESSFSAFHYADVGVLEEALRYGAVTHLASNAKGVYPPLAAVTQWAKSKGLRQVRVSALLSAAENLAALRQTAQAAAALDEAQNTMGRRPMAQGRLGARLSFLRGLTLFQQHKAGPGDAAIADALAYMRRGSLWLFQLAQADGRLVADQITPRTAMELYKELLRDPKATDWVLDPMESLAVLATPHPAVYERWFLVAMKRNDHEAALEISDRARRHRFFSSLAYGGRLHVLRWILEASDEAINPTAMLQRQDVVADYPAFGKLSQQVRQLREQVRNLPMVPQDQEALREQSRLYGEIAALSQQQEAMLREIAVSRRPAEMVFPPLVPTRELQKSIPRGTAVLAFFAAGSDLYAFLLTQDKYGFWTVKTTSAALGRKIVALLREMGHFEQNHELGAADLANAQWKQTARQLLEGLLAGSSADFTRRFPELVVVPDGMLWYVPFEALQVNVNHQLQPLIARFRIRYAPTVSLAVPDRRGRSPAAETAVVVGKLYPRDDAQVAQAACEQLAKVLPGTVALSKPPLPAPSALYKLRLGRLIVLDDLSPAEGTSIYGWAPVPIERNKPGNALDDWLALPWGGPEVIVLPGFHTAAENSLKRIHRTAPGSEMFLTVCALLSTGAETLLISRWRTGGQTSFDLVREFAQELPHAAPSEAWQRAVLLTMASRVKTDAEPRLKRSTAGDDVLKAEHPFFWAGYLLIDNGNPAAKTEAEPGKPDAKPVLKNQPGDDEKPGAQKKPDEAIKPMARGNAQADGHGDDPKGQLAPGAKPAPAKALRPPTNRRGRDPEDPTSARRP